MSQEYNYKQPKYRHLAKTIWSPIYPPFYPVFSFKDISNRCFKWSFLTQFKGAVPNWSKHFIRPNSNPIEDFENYWDYEKAFFNLLYESLRLLSRNKNNSSLWVMYRQKDLGGFLQEILSSNVKPDSFEIFAVRQVFNYLTRLGLKERRKDYWINPQLMFKSLQITPLGSSYIMLRNSNKPHLPILNWIGNFAGLGNISLLDFTTKQMKIIKYLSKDFFDPPINWQKLPEWFEELHVIPELNKLWLFKTALLQMIKYQDFYIPMLTNEGKKILDFQNLLTKLANINEFELIVDFIDYSIPISNYNHLDFPQISGEGLINNAILHSASPHFILNYHNCFFSKKHNTCPLKFSCKLGDRRIRTQRGIDRDLSEQNTYKFLRLIRNEKTLYEVKKHAVMGLWPNYPKELSEQLSFWIGLVYFHNNQMFFEDLTPDYWKREPRKTKQYDVILQHPWIFERLYKVTFDEEITTHHWRLIPNKTDIFLDIPFTKADTKKLAIPCLIGGFDFSSFNYIENLQKRNLAKNIHFKPFDSNRKPKSEEAILRTRLGDKGKRMGEAIFGDKARFV